MNSFFASCEQQANFLLRGKPIAVASHNGSNSIILAASIEAKKYKIKTGTKKQEAQKLCPGIIFLENDPPKYRAISDSILNILKQYSDNVSPYSIDESFIDLTGWAKTWDKAGNTALEIKQRIKNEVGDWLKCSIGISFTRFLAKVGSDIKKPDGLTIIKPKDIPDIYKSLDLIDIWGIGQGWKKRLNKIQIKSPFDLYNYPLQNLVSLFGKSAYYLYANLHGQQTSYTPNKDNPPKSISHQYAIPKKENTSSNLPKILMKLCEKVGRRLRQNQMVGQIIFVHLRYYKGSGVSMQKKLAYPLRSTLEIYHHATEILKENLSKQKIHVLSVGTSGLINENQQIGFWERKPKDKINKIDDVMDSIKNKYGDFSIVHGTMIGAKNFIPDRIGFGK